MTDKEINEALRDQAIHGVSIMQDGKRIDPADVFKSSEELTNEAVALKLGWRNLNGAWFAPVKGAAYLAEPGFADIRKEPPDYCHSIEAAWEIVEKLAEGGFDAIFHSGFWSKKHYYRIEIFSSDEAFYDVKADTAPMAICLAFLKLENFK